MYPSSQDSFSVITGATYQDTDDHASRHNNEGSAIVGLETTLGTTAGTSVLKSFNAGDFPARLNASNVLQQAIAGTINNSTLGTPSIYMGTLTSVWISNSTIISPVIGSPAFDGTAGGIYTLAGTPTISSPTITGGTVSSAVINNATIGTSAITGGTANNVNLGTPVITGGTITSPVLNTGVSGSALAATSDVATGTSTSLLATPASVAPYANNSLFRQAIINGNFDIWQRGTSIVTTGGYTADLWLVATSAGTNATTQDTDVPNVLSKYSHKIVQTNITAAGKVDRKYRIESIDATKLSGKTMTLSFWHKESTTAGTVTPTVIISYASAADNFTTVGQTFASISTITASATWVKHTYTFTLPATSNTGGYAIGNGIEILIECTQNTSTGNLTSNIAQVQLCAGDVALPFMPKSYGDELRACQRYYIQYSSAAAYMTFGSGTCGSTTRCYVSIHLPTSMRTTIPTVTTGGSFRLYDSGSYTVTAIITDSASNDKVQTLFADVAAGLTAGRSAILQNNNDTTAYIAFSAEL